MKDFEKIYSEHYDAVFLYVLSLCRDEAWAEEITQEAFFKGLKTIDTFRGECKLNVWLCQIAKNTFYTAAKRRQRQVDYPLEMISSDESIGQKIYDKETAFQIHKLLHNIEEPYKEVFWMHTFYDVDFETLNREISSIHHFWSAEAEHSIMSQYKDRRFDIKPFIFLY